MGKTPRTGLWLAQFARRRGAYLRNGVRGLEPSRSLSLLDWRRGRPTAKARSRPGTARTLGPHRQGRARSCRASVPLLSPGMTQPDGAVTRGRPSRWTLLGFRQFDLAGVPAEFVHRRQGVAEARHPQEGCAPVRDAREIVDEPSKRLLHLIEGADEHHEFAKG